MIRKSFLIGAGIAAAFAAALLGFGSSAQAQPYGGGWGQRGKLRADCPIYRTYGPGYTRTGRGYGRGYMRGGRGNGAGYGPGGWRGPGYGPGWSAPTGDLKLTIDDVKTRFERWLAVRGNSRLKLGEIKDKDADTIVADIVTKDNSLVERFSINRHDGYFQRNGD